jgi:hypothetical protein
VLVRDPLVLHPDKVRQIMATRVGRSLDQNVLADDLRVIGGLHRDLLTHAELLPHEDGTICVVIHLSRSPTATAGR